MPSPTGSDSEARVTLSPASAPEFLRAQGLFRGVQAHAEVLSGGVSATVVRVRAGPSSFVLKQPLSRFDVAEEWLVPTRRVEVEARVGRLLARHIGPESIAPVRGFDAHNEVLVLEGLPDGARSLKQQLMKRQMPMDAIEEAGSLLARIHQVVTVLPDRAAFREDALFRAQRIEPYFETAAQRDPDLADTLADIAGMFFPRDDLVHGDFSPKNLMVSSSGKEVRIIDHEVATRGDAAFDLGFFLTHLVMKAVHFQDHGPFRNAGARFLAAYFRAMGKLTSDAAPAREQRALRYLGGLLLGRSLGKSRPEYLTARQRDEVAAFGRRILAGSPRTWDVVWRGDAC